jgi:ribonuclease HI
VYIMSDQAAIRALKSNTLAVCLDNLKRLTTKCKLTLMWVPNHSGVDETKGVDQLANKGKLENSVFLYRRRYNERELNCPCVIKIVKKIYHRRLFL